MKIKDVQLRSGAALRVTELSLGSAPLGDLFRKLDEAEAQNVVRSAYADGVRLFDTSPHYGNGLSEARMGAALRDKPRDDLVISTKVGRWMDPFAPVEKGRSDVISPGFAGGFPHKARFDYTYDGTMRSVEQSLLRMGLDRIDILLIHDCDVWTHGRVDVEAKFSEAMDGAYKALDKLRADGTVKAIGVGLNEADMCERFAEAGDFDVMLLAGRYSLLEQPALERFLPLAVEKRIGIILAGVFNSGILATGAVEGAKYNYTPAPPDVLARVEEIQAVCESHGVSIRQAALRFAFLHPAVISVLLGAEKPEEIRANVADIDTKVPDGLWSDLKSRGLLQAGAPTP